MLKYTRKMKETTERKTAVVSAAALIAAEAALYITFNCAGLDHDADIAVKYAGVILCAAYAAAAVRSGRLSSFLLAAAMAFTVVSDFFLLVTGRNTDTGLITFIIAQLLHFASIYAIRGKPPLVSGIIRLALSAAALAAAAALDMFSVTIALAAVYFVNLLVNFADAAALIGLDRRYIALAAGFALFIACDVCVGLFNSGSAAGIDIPASAVRFAEKGMWAFYLPSQTLIVLSHPTKKNVKKRNDA